MKSIVNLVDDFRPGGIRSLLDDMASSGPWRPQDWEIDVVNASRPIKLTGAPDVIVIHYSMAWRKLAALALLRLRYRNAKIIIVEHHYTRSFEQHQVRNRRRFRSMLRAAYANADQVIAVSESQAAWLRSIDVVDWQKIRVISSCRDYAKFLAIPRIDKSTGSIVIGAMGRLAPEKGFDVLINAIRELPAEHYQLRIAGDGEERDRLLELAADLPHVELVGHTDDPAGFLADCDVLAMPSRQEAFGLVCAEAKAAGLPVVVTNVDALPQQARGCGVIVEPEDAEGLAAGLEYVSNSNRLRVYRERARKSVVNAWSQYLSAWSAALA
jgi:glycosyltransferase involved in cell wall biosynthesis